MDCLLAESSGVAIKSAILETIEAVNAATSGLDSDDGATAQAVGKILGLDKSAARRRLIAAQKSRPRPQSGGPQGSARTLPRD